MKLPNSQARLLRDLKRHVRSVNPGSEPFTSGLKAIESTAWELLKARGVEWSAIGNRTVFAYTVHCYTSSPDGLTETYTTPGRTPKPETFTAYQKVVRKLAKKTLGQYERTCHWVMDRYDEALESGALNDRMKLRCLTGRAAFENLVSKRFDDVQAMTAGRASSALENQLAEFVARHGQAHSYRDHLYSSKLEAQNALRADTRETPADHDLIVSLFEEAFPPDGYDDDKFEALCKYLRSQDHKDALKFSEEMGADTSCMNRHDRTVLLVATAERRLAALSDPLPRALYKKLRVSKETLRTIMLSTPKPWNKATVNAALREKMYLLCPSKRPRKPKPQEATQ